LCGGQMRIIMRWLDMLARSRMFDI
jgi:hypothetical protein